MRELIFQMPLSTQPARVLGPPRKNMSASEFPTVDVILSPWNLWGGALQGHLMILETHSKVPTPNG